MRKLVFAFLPLMLFLAGCASQSADDGTLTIGWMGPLSGDAASYGESIQRGVELAIADSRLDIEVVYEDSKCDPSESVNVISKLISLDGVDAVIGEVCSGATLAAAPIASQNQVVMISSSSTSPKLSDQGIYIFRTVPSDALQSVFAAKLIAEDGHATLAMLYSNDEYGVGLTDSLETEFEKLGGEVVASETFERGASDLRTQVTKIKAEEPDAIYIVSNSPDAAVAALVQLKELGVDAALYGSEGLKSDDILEGSGSASNGLTVTSVSSGATSFASAHEEAYGVAPGPFAAQAYDAMQALILAAENGATTGQEVQAFLSSVEFKGASGDIMFDAQGDVSGNYDVFVAENGAFVVK